VKARVLAAIAAALLAGCATPVDGPRPDTPAAAGGDGGAAVIRRALPESTPGPAGSSTAPATRGAAPLAGIRVPSGLLYVCVTNDAGTQRQVGIEFSGKVHQLCERHPEMGPCQYERNACRQGGGRVFDAGDSDLVDEADVDMITLNVTVSF